MEENKIVCSLKENLKIINNLLDGSMDFNSNLFAIGNTDVAVLTMEGLISSEALSLSLFLPLLDLSKNKDITFDQINLFFENKSALSAEQVKVYDYDTLLEKMMSGFAVLLIDGINTAYAFGVQGYKSRSVDKPSNENNELGSKEAFVEPIRVNISMIRRRIKSSELMFEKIDVKGNNNTDVCLVYLKNKAADKTVNEVKKRISKAELNMILDSSYLAPFLEKSPYSLFSGVGYTERPDVLCGKINEGRVAVLTDGSPFALVVPFLFNENFKTFDDYAHRPYFSTFIRIIKYISFFVSFVLPGAYVAIVTFNPELILHSLFLSIADSEEIIPFSLTLEAVFIYIVFEIMREAGIRLPSAIGHTIGIVGALVIGDAAVNAGLIGAPMVMVVAITAICAFAIPKLYEPVMILRFLFIIIGGLFGIFGIALSLVIVLAIICSMNSLNIPMTAPSVPLNKKWLVDSFAFSGIKKLKKNNLLVQDLNKKRG